MFTYFGVMVLYILVCATDIYKNWYAPKPLPPIYDIINNNDGVADMGAIKDLLIKAQYGDTEARKILEERFPTEFEETKAEWELEDDFINDEALQAGVTH